MTTVAFLPVTAPPVTTPQVGDRVHCGRSAGWLCLIGTVFAIDPVNGFLRVQERQTGMCVNVHPASARVIP